LPIDPRRGEYLLPDGLNLLMKQMNVWIHITDPFRDIGSIELWMKANNKIYQDGYLYPPQSIV
jgi:hypothetical protein